jgi:hypothetical protein
MKKDVNVFALKNNTGEIIGILRLITIRGLFGFRVRLALDSKQGYTIDQLPPE